jgi:hypothetical protein
MYPVRAISINQPWAHFIVNGAINRNGEKIYKDVENRTWETAYRGTVLIHASKKKIVQTAELRDELDRIGVTLPMDFQMKFGGIIGKADLVKVLTGSDSPWFTGPFGFKLVNVWPVEFTPIKGQLGFFNLPFEVYQRLGVDPYNKTFGRENGC